MDRDKPVTQADAAGKLGGRNSIGKSGKDDRIEEDNEPQSPEIDASYANETSGDATEMPHVPVIRREGTLFGKSLGVFGPQNPIRRFLNVLFASR